MNKLSKTQISQLPNDVAMNKISNLEVFINKNFFNFVKAGKTLSSFNCPEIGFRFPAPKKNVDHF